MAVLTHWDGEPLQVWQDLWRAPLVEAHDELGSTNDRARALAAEGAGPFTVVVADAQREGRGRSGARWHAPEGQGLWISVLLPAEGGPPPHLALLVGVAAARAAEEVCPGLVVGIKWPNDLEIHGRKVGGVLCEHGRGAVVAGVGVNVSQKPEAFPDDIADRATSLEAAHHARVSLGGLATGLLHHLWALCAAAGPRLAPPVHEELARRDALRDRPILTQQAGEGVARGVQPDGALVLERPDGRRVRVVAGSVRLV
jgi:BirA family biotin operon repressor/biotin-[acetyl-CoA-carboxylase] ligase